VRNYLHLVRHRAARWPLLTSTLSRLTPGMMALALVLLSRDAGFSYAVAGVVTAAHQVGVGLAAPIQGRLVDRFGQTVVLIPDAVMYALGTVALAWLATIQAPVAVLVAIAVVAGAFYLLTQVDGYRPEIIDDRNFYQPAGTRKWVKNGFLNKDIKVPLGIAWTFRSHIEPDLLLQNLVGNAVKFTNRGHVKVSFLPGKKTGKDAITLVVQVEDTGIGIPEDKQNLIFQSFKQVDERYAREFGGTGLGLAISSRLIEMMGGRIWVSSAEGAGSRFSLELRRAESAVFAGSEA
jgi:hypothetical protein